MAVGRFVRRQFQLQGAAAAHHPDLNGRSVQLVDGRFEIRALRDALRADLRDDVARRQSASRAGETDTPSARISGTPTTMTPSDSILMPTAFPIGTRVFPPPAASAPAVRGQAARRATDKTDKRNSPVAQLLSAFFFSLKKTSISFIPFLIWREKLQIHLFSSSCNALFEHF
jgi:hypothetical protein